MAKSSILGGVPIDSPSVETEVLMGTAESTEANFLFAVDDQRLVGMEMFSDIDSDSCELRFFDDHLEGELSFPGEIQFGPAGQPRSTIKIQQIEFLD